MTSPGYPATRRTCALLVAATFGVAGAAAGASPTTIFVNSTADVVADDGTCTLREAATAANNHAPSGATPGECAAGTASNEVVFVLPPASTIHLSGAVVFTESAHLYGGGPDQLTIEQDAADRVLVFDGRLLSIYGFGLRGLTLTGGDAAGAYDGLYPGEGGGLLAIAAPGMAIDWVRFLDNAASQGGAALAMHDVGLSPIVERSTFEGNVVSGGTGGGGGALLVQGGGLQLRTSLFHANQASNDGASALADSPGGAIWIEGGSAVTVTIEETTFDGNSARGAGGALALGQAPAADHADVTATIVDSTFTGNAADTDADALPAAGGGLHLAWNDGFTTLTNCIVASNTDGSSAVTPAPDLRAPSASAASGGYNLIGIGAGAALVFQDGVSGDQVGSVATPIPPQLLALDDNGGPTRSRLPIATHGSPVIDQGSCSGSFYDQREWTELGSGLRIYDFAGTADADDGCDVGAVELLLDPPPEIFSSGFEFGDTRYWSGVEGFVP